MTEVSNDTSEIGLPISDFTNSHIHELRVREDYYETTDKSIVHSDGYITIQQLENFAMDESEIETKILQ